MAFFPVGKHPYRAQELFLGRALVTLNPWFVLVNPYAGKGHGRNRAADLIPLMRSYGIAPELAYTNGSMHACELARDAVLRGHRRFVAVGGDGTVNEILSGLCSQPVIPTERLTLAAVGGGTGDDWLRTLEMPRGMHEVVACIARGKTISIDVGLVTCRSQKGDVRRHFISMAGAGIDALIAGECASKRAGSLKYLLTLVWGARRYRESSVSVSGGGRTITAPIFTVLLNLGRYGAGGMKIAPHAKLDDGLFEMTIVGRMAPWRIVWESRRLFNGTLWCSPLVECARLSRVTITGEPAVPVQTDGEVVGITPADFSVLPRALCVIVPDTPDRQGANA